MLKLPALRQLLRATEQVYFKFLVIYLVFFALSAHKLDPDFGWHLKAGDYYRNHGIPSRDIFSYTAPNFRWINHEWGNDLILSLFYSLGGYWLAAGVYGGIWTTAFYIRAKTSRLLFLLAGVAAVLPYAGIRPIAWTALLFACLLNLLERSKKPAWWAVAALFGLWVNLHGGFVLGLAVLLYYFVKYRQFYYVKLLVVGVLATFINPYGPRIYAEVWRTLTDSQLHNQVTEWHSLVIFRASLVFIGLWWAGFVLFRRKKLGNWLGIGPLTFAAAMSASRNMPLFIIAGLPDLEKFYKQLRNEAPKKLPRGAKFILGGTGAVIAAALIYTGYGNFWPWGRLGGGYPQKAVSYLTAKPCPGNLFNDYDYGGYLIWKLPSEKVYIDGRMPSWRDPNGQKYLNRYFDVLKNADIRQSEFKKYDIRCVLIRSSETRFINGLKDIGWSTRLTTNGATLLEKP